MEATLERFSSQESEIDRQLEDLIGKMVQGVATADDQRAYLELSARRAKLMQPPIGAEVNRLRVRLLPRTRKR